MSLNCDQFVTPLVPCVAKKQPKGRWPQFKENYYNDLGSKYDKILKGVNKEKAEGFCYYMK